MPPAPAARPLAIGPPVPRPHVTPPEASAPQQVADVSQLRDPVRPKPAGDGAGIGITGGLVAIDVDRPGAAETPLDMIAFSPGSAALPTDATERLEQLVAEAKGRSVAIKVVAEGPSQALALDRARAVGLALVRAGVSAGQVEVRPVGDAQGNRAGVFLASQAMP
jgi:outer membrane protein OmpA-like peptidoglycan-associated protein